MPPNNPLATGWAGDFLQCPMKYNIQHLSVRSWGQVERNEVNKLHIRNKTS